ncbi:LysR family transcriptional regulator [Pseudoduganella eburnea]|uniref:LysR family transcriptional regulator n=1 Tax=Massilia eburnea TaxID=1776165 RepID=A0A6L6QPW7_9BURK|nr:LysR family transcriptional regulator [Massilia eburnea]MTW14468.1 LysR family transcriptional regulator [Massilia eburnea]
MDRITSANVFVTIAERGSLAGAAEALDMSRAMVTRYLAEMEEWAGARLFHRTTRRLSLTSAGEVTLSRCRELLALAGEVATAGDPGAGEPRGLLRVACSQFLSQTALAGAMVGFLRRYPNARVDLQVDNRAVNLVEQRIDLAIRITNALEPGLIARRLGECRSLLCAAPSYIAEHGLPSGPQDLARHNCLTYSYFGKSTWQFTREGEAPAPAAEAVEVPVGGNLSANESMALLAAAGKGAGIAMQPRFAAQPMIDTGVLVEVLSDWQPQSLGIHAIYTSRQHMPPVLRAMLDYLADWFATDPGWLSAA